MLLTTCVCIFIYAVDENSLLENMYHENVYLLDIIRELNINLSGIFKSSCFVVQPVWKSISRSLKKLGMEPPYDQVIPLLIIYTEELKSFYDCDTYIPLFKAAQFKRTKL